MGSMLTTYMMDSDLKVQIQVKIHLGYLQLEHNGNQSYLILDLIFISLRRRLPLSLMFSLTKKLSKNACILAKIHSALVNS